MTETKIFNGGLNTDDSPYRVPSNDYIDALNITHDAVEGSNDQNITPIIANRIGDNTYVYPSSVNKCIGAYPNTLRNTVIQFIWNGLNKHSILEFSFDTRRHTKIFENITDSAGINVLDFTESGKILSVNIYNREEGDLLFFLDSLGKPCGFDITLFKQGYYNPVTRDLIQKAKMPPLKVPQVIYSNDTTKRSNDLRDKFFKFRTRYIYDDFEKSTFSPLSKMPLPVSILTDTYTNVITNNNVIILSASTGGRNVKSIEIGMQYVSKTSVWSDLLSVTTINKKDLVLTETHQILVSTTGTTIAIITFSGIPIPGSIVYLYLTQLPSTKILVGSYTILSGDTLNDVAVGLAANMLTLGLTITPSAYSQQVAFAYNNLVYAYDAVEFDNSGAVDNVNFTYNFYNDSTYPSVNIEEAVQLFDYTPSKANCQELLNGNILAYAGIEEGYNKDTIADSTITIGVVSSGASGGGSFSAVVTNIPSPPFLQITKYALSGIPTVGTVVNIKVKRSSDHAIIIASTYTTVFGDTIYTIEAALGANNTLLPNVDIVFGYGNVFVYVERSMYEVITDPYFSIMEITAPSTTGNSKPTWKWSSQRTIARQYFDKNGVTNGVLYTDNVSFPAYSENGSNEPMLPYINYKINDIPPYWAYSMTFLVNKSSVNYLFWKTILVNTDETEYIYLEVTSLVTNSIKKPTTAAVCSYTFKDGDRVRIIRDSDTPGIVFPDTYDAAVEGLVVDPVINTVATTGGREFIKIKNISPFTGNIISTKNYVIELYSPTQQVGTSDNQTFVEIGIQYDIINPTLSTRTHSGEVTDQVVGVVPAEYNLYEGDAYFRRRVIAKSDVGYDDFSVIDANVVDFYISKVSSIDGRPSVIDINAKKQYYSTLIRFGEAYQANTNINGLNRFYYKNSDEYDYSFGDVMALVVKNRQMTVLQKLKIGSVPLFSALGKDASGLQVIFQTDKLLNPIQYYVGDFGIGTCPESVASFNYAIYGCDNIKGVIWRLSNDGVKPLSVMFKMNSWANKFINNTVKIYGAYDQRLNNYIITLKEEVPTCIPVVVPAISLPIGYIDNLYNYNVPLSGTAPFSLSSIVKPAWLSITIAGSNILFTGTPNAELIDELITFTVTNACGLSDVETTLNIEEMTPGIILPFGGLPTAVPAGYLLCDGAAVSRTTYASLFGIIGTIWGSGDGSTTFNLPTIKKQVLAGYDAADAQYNMTALTGGLNTHTISVAELPAHNHFVFADVTTTRLNDPFSADDAIARGNPTEAGNSEYRLDPIITAATKGKSSSVGSGTSIDIRNSFVVVPHIIKT